MTSDSTPAFEIEKEALKTEIETGIQAGVDHLEAKTAKRKDADKYHNTRHLLKQYRKVAYAIQISEADMNVRMEMEHGTRLSTLEVNAELAGVDLSGSKLEGYARTVIRSKNMLQIIDNALNTVRMDPDHGELMYQVLYLTYFSKKKPANREVILAELDRQGFPMSMVTYGFGGSSSNTQYPESDFGSSSIISDGGTIVMPYEPSVTLNDLKQSDGSIGQVSIERVGLNCKVYEGATDSSMSKGAGHYTSSGLYTGNVGLFGHNRGNHPYFGKLKNVKVGDIVKYKTAIGTKTYKVTFVGAISYTDFSYLNEMGDNRITLITCIANQPSLRLCVQAVEIR